MNGNEATNGEEKPTEQERYERRMFLKKWANYLLAHISYNMIWEK